jgi:hypothetical protein
MFETPWRKEVPNVPRIIYHFLKGGKHCSSLNFPTLVPRVKKKSIFVHNLHVQFCISRQTCDTWRPVSVSKCAFVFACYRTKVLRSTFENVETHSADEQCCFEIVFAETTGNHFC